MSSGAVRVESLALQLLDAQVTFHLDRLAGDQVASTVTRLADDIFAATGRHRILVLVDREAIEVIVVRALGTVPGSAAVSDIIELATTMASRVMGRIVGVVLQANKAVTDKVPGRGSLMSFGTSAASK